MSERGQVVARYEVRAGDQRALAYLRAFCAVLALCGAIAMLLGALPLPLFMVAVLAVLLSVAWLAQSRRLAKAARATSRPSLTAYTHGLWIEEATGNEWLPWSDVMQIEVDEERLDVVITKREGARRRIEPRYGGVDLYELVHTLTQVWSRASAAERVGS